MISPNTGGSLTTTFSWSGSRASHRQTSTPYSLRQSRKGRSDWKATGKQRRMNCVFVTTEPRQGKQLRRSLFPCAGLTENCSLRSAVFTTVAPRNDLPTVVQVPPWHRRRRRVSCSAGSIVPPDALFVSVVFPRRTLSRPELAGAPIAQVLQKIGHLDRPVEMPVPTRFLTDLGVPLENVEQAICVVTGIRTTGDASSAEEELDERIPRTGRVEEHAAPDREQDSWLYGPLMEAYVVRLTGPAPRDEAVDLLFRPQEIALGGKTYFGQGKDTGAVAVHFPDERTMIVGEERVVRQMLAPADRPQCDWPRPWTDLTCEADILGVIDVAAVREQLSDGAETGPAVESRWPTMPPWPRFPFGSIRDLRRRSWSA